VLRISASFDPLKPTVDHYLTAGCGRCAGYDTPECSVHNWHNILVELRRVLLSCGLTEEIKWGNPCYTLQKKNITMLGAFKENCTMSFFKGALLSDSSKLLEKAGENTQAGRVIRFTSEREVTKMETTLREYIFEAIEAERAGLKVKKKPEPWSEELIARFNSFPAFKEAFEALTQGR